MTSYYTIDSSYLLFVRSVFQSEQPDQSTDKFLVVSQPMVFHL